jgi:hypothetical protein
MSNSEPTVFDTDMFIHRLSMDELVKNAAINVFKQSRPTAICSFSLLELKGNYIQDLILLRKKIYASDSLGQASAKISITGQRKAMLMLLKLIEYLGGYDFPVKPWEKAKNHLVTVLDGQIAVSWHTFHSFVDSVLDDLNCTRAKEPPNDDSGEWRASIPKCNERNTDCQIATFMNSYKKDLQTLFDFLNELTQIELKEGDELYKIKKVVKTTLDNSSFPWGDYKCRSVGDLLIGLQSKIGSGLISSNKKEHAYLSRGLNYRFVEFPVANIRSK